jgi:methionine salvage enolase-phosphatase E1
MKRFMTFVSSVALVFTVLFPFAAEARRDQVRESRQQHRIREGVKSGELTRKEAHHLRAGQRRVDRLQRKAKADGEITPAEKMRIEKAQDKQSAAIYKQKHDAQERPEQTEGGQQ